MSKPAVVLFGSLLLIVLSGSARRASAQTTLVVDDDHVQCPSAGFTTISAAVAAASAGDTVQVCAGTYAEGVNVNKQLTLLGARAGVDARDPSRTAASPPATESVVTGAGNSGITPFNVTASGVIINGFTVQGATSTTQFGFGILIGAGTNGTQILNNVVQNNIAGLSLANNSTTTATVIQHNLFRTNNQTGPISGTAIYTDQFNAGGTLTNVLIDDNTFDTNDNVGVLLGSTQSGSQSNVTVSNNIMNANGNGYLAFNLTSSSVRRNTITNSVGSQVVFGGGVSGVTVTENFIQNGATNGIRIGDFGGGSPNSNISANCNSISGNTASGLNNGDSPNYTGTLDARFDWWGSATGPTIASNPGGTGDAIIDPDGEVVYRPFLTSGADANPSAPGFQCPAATAGSAVINEFRLRGSGGAQDEFVEIYNTADTDVIVGDSDPSGGTQGWSLVSDDAPTTVKCVVPNDTIIPARGHFLCANLAGYSLSDYGGTGAAAPDAPITADIPNGAGLALFRTANTASLTAANRLDAVGFSGSTFNEGTPLLPAGGIADDSEHSFVRDLTSGRPKDTDNNQVDFVFVATDGASHSGRQSVLGAPGPENLASPVMRNQEIKASLVAPCLANTSSPNRERSLASGGAGTPTASGTFTIRRKFTNNTGTGVTRLRFRVVDITTLNSPGYSPTGTQADLRVLSSPDDTFANPCGSPTSSQGLTLEEPPTQAVGGGLNSTLSAGTITLATPLAAGASINFNFLLGVAKGGSFRFFVNVEALPGLPPPPPVAGIVKPAKAIPGAGVNAKSAKGLRKN